MGKTETTTLAQGEVLTVPAYSKWAEKELMAFSDNEYMQKLYHRAKDIGDDLYDWNTYEFIEMDPAAYKANLITYMRRRAWSEWYFGTVAQAREITLLPEDQVQLKLRLARQIQDEMRHYDVFAQQLKRYGSEPRIDEFELPPILVEMQKVQTEARTAPEIAAANQFAGEIVLSSMTDLPTSIFKRLFDKELMDAIEDIERDEPPHIANGKDLILLACSTFGERKTLADTQERYLSSMMQLHVTEIVKLGCRRVKPLPVFE
ncbi:MAG TPA: ferritin-like domain-containing protein [bacterium]|nr:ferritin-like domain-containing protein [bacterium]